MNAEPPLFKSSDNNDGLDAVDVQDADPEDDP